ncbi:MULTISPECIES: hypothetical protein [unclassified Pedobacter]|uniref:hypothetical protein n=1 Tax=Pedobacter TaxID=84567 RepID=UPI00209C6E13|nr:MULTISPECIES: hypothetical protein [unclassified Pedobacter]MCX2583249.1 hypothetical protein [Pedobacter sp. MR22-3]
MKRRNIVMLSTCLSLALFSSALKAQTKVALFDGTIVAGYVDHGGYVNCIGPSVKYLKKPFSISAGLLPSLRIKEDKVAAGATKNSLITPSLGLGLTAVFNHIALQLPLYYNAKTSTKNGEWNVGVGLGYKL